MSDPSLSVATCHEMFCIVRTMHVYTSVIVRKHSFPTNGPSSTTGPTLRTNARGSSMSPERPPSGVARALKECASRMEVESPAPWNGNGMEMEWK